MGSCGRRKRSSGAGIAAEHCLAPSFEQSRYTSRSTVQQVHTDEIADLDRSSTVCVVRMCVSLLPLLFWLLIPGRIFFQLFCSFKQQPTFPRILRQCGSTHELGARFIIAPHLG